nr:MAG TPA: hypothetical protein [Caudoviricetes sp.]
MPGRFAVRTFRTVHVQNNEINQQCGFLLRVEKRRF